MDKHLEDRLRRVIDRRRATMGQRAQGEPALEEQRLAREHLLAAIPGALQRLEGAVGELQDSLSEVGLHLKLDTAPEVPTLEGSFIVSLWPSPDPPVELHLNINHEGRLVALLVRGERRTPVGAKDVWHADRPFFHEGLIALLEADQA